MQEPIYVHVQATITINNSDSNWYSPRISETINFSIPEEMFVAGKLTTAVESRIKSLVKNYPEAITEYEAQRNREREEKEAKEAKAKAEAEAELDTRIGNVIMTPS